MKAKSDFLFFGLLGLLIVNTIVHSFTSGYILSINNYLGFVSWVIALVLRLGNFKWRRYSLGFLLILGTFNILNFTIGEISLSVSVGVQTPGINPVIVLVLVAYYFINKKSINGMFSNLFQGTEEDRKLKQDKMVDFYLKKFSNCDDAELRRILQNFSDYPTAAQIALNQIKEQRAITAG